MTDDQNSPPPPPTTEEVDAVGRELVAIKHELEALREELVSVREAYDHEVQAHVASKRAYAAVAQRADILTKRLEDAIEDNRRLKKRLAAQKP